LAILPKAFRGNGKCDFKLLLFCTEPAIRDIPANLLTEIVGTFTLVFGVLTMTAPGNLGHGPGLAQALGPLVVTLLIWAIGLSLGGPTGYAINPARDLGPRIAHALLPIPGKRSSDFAYGWVPIVGPIIGGAIGAGLYMVLFGATPPPRAH
jgi:glycerol uptake facilitator protein